MCNDDFKEKRIILQNLHFMLVVTSYGASDGMFMLFQQNTTELSVTFGLHLIHQRWSFNNTAYAV